MDSAGNSTSGKSLSNEYPVYLDVFWGKIVRTSISNSVGQIDSDLSPGTIFNVISHRRLKTTHEILGRRAELFWGKLGKIQELLLSPRVQPFGNSPMILFHWSMWSVPGKRTPPLIISPMMQPTLQRPISGPLDVLCCTSSLPSRTVVRMISDLIK